MKDHHVTPKTGVVIMKKFSFDHRNKLHCKW